MVMRFMDSFDHYITGQVAQKWTSVGGVAPTIASPGRNGSCLNAISNAFAQVTVPTQSTYVVGFAFRYNGVAPTQDIDFLHFYDVGSLHCGVCVRADSTVAVRRLPLPGTILGSTSPFALNLGQWYYIEVKMTASTTVGAATVNIDEVTRINVSGVNTSQAGSTNITNIRIGVLQGSTTTYQFDDLYILDTTGSINNNILGDMRINAIFPIADGTHLDWTPDTGTQHFTRVNQTSPDGDTTYVLSSTSGHRDSYLFEALPASVANIKAIQLNLNARKDDAGARTISPLVRSGGTTYEGPSQSLLNTYKDFWTPYDTNPATSAAWTPTEVNNAEFGAEMNS